MRSMSQLQPILLATLLSAGFACDPPPADCEAGKVCVFAGNSLSECLAPCNTDAGCPSGTSCTCAKNCAGYRDCARVCR